MRPIKELNISDNRPLPTETDIYNLEMTIGYRLPEVFVEFIKNNNGGSPQLDTFECEESGEWSVNNFFYIGGEESEDSIIWNYYNRWEGISATYMPFGRDGGDNIFLLNLTENQKGEVWIWIHDEPLKNLRKLSNRFEQFIDGLHLNQNYI